MIHADHCIDAPLDHQGPCKQGFSVAGQFTEEDRQGVDDSLATPITDSNRRHRVEGVSNPTEMVDHPAHYGGRDDHYEAIKVIEAWDLGFCLGNTVKYIARAGKKGSLLEDLKKARWYLDRHISRLENNTPA